MANTEDLKSSEVIPPVGSSPTSGTNLYPKLIPFLLRNGLRLKIVVDIYNPGVEGHPIALEKFLQFLGKNR